MAHLSRRDVFRLVGAAALLAKLPACGDNAGDRVFTADELALLGTLADVILPPDDQPGGRALGTIPYIEMLATAYDAAIPKIYAGGPSSDRSGGATNDFARFVELDRVSDAAWRLALDGNAGAPGLVDQLKAGLAAARAMKIADPAALFDQLDDGFRHLLIELVSEAAFCAPEYGGNPDLAGWRMVHFEGDSQPRGYSQWNGAGYDERPDAPMSTANPFDPEPLTDDVRAVLQEVVLFLGGKAFP